MPRPWGRPLSASSTDLAPLRAGSNPARRDCQILPAASRTRTCTFVSLVKRHLMTWRAVQGLEFWLKGIL
jgi:hypothetical protein